MDRNMSITLGEHVDVEKGGQGHETIKAVLESGLTTPVSAGNVDGDGSSIKEVTRARTRNSTAELKHVPRFLHRIFQKSNSGVEIDADPPPDGGLRAWTIVVCCHMAGFNTFGFLNAYGVLQTIYVSMLKLPPSDVSWIGSIQAFLLLFVSAFSGRFTDAGYFHQTLFIGTVFQLVGIFAASFSTTYWQLILSHGVCVGLGGGLVFCPSMSLVGTYFSKRRPLALAICAIGNSVGGLVYAAILQQMIKHVGFSWAMRVCGFLMMGTLVPANFLLKPRAIRRNVGPLFEWSAFREPVYAFFALGMFFSFLGQWVPVFYVSFLDFPPLAAN
jgi:MFS family permease